MAVVLRYPLHWRSWRLRWVLGLVVLTMLARVAWGWHVERMLAGQIAEIRGRGEPVEAGDVVYEAVPDAENAWALQVQAANAQVSGAESPRASNEVYRNYPPYSAAWLKRAERSETAQALMFTLARKARALSRVQTRDRVTSPVVMSMLGGWNNARNLANTITDGAAYAHLKGNDDEALERLFDVLHQSSSLRRDDFMVSQLVATGIDGLAMNAAQIIGPGLRLAEGSTSREKARGLIAQLLDEESTWRGFEASLRMERLATLDSLKWCSKEIQLIQPIAEMEAVRANRNFDILARAARLRNKPAADAVLAQVRREDPDDNDPLRWTMQPAGPTMPRYSRWFRLRWAYFPMYFETQFRAIAERRMTAVSLAAQLYRADHGRWPARLEELAPSYLPALPTDPYRGDGQAIGYNVAKNASGGDRPLVYSEWGPDLPGMILAEPMYEITIVSAGIGKGRLNGRQYRDLSRFAPPSAQAVDGDPEKSDAPRNQAK